MGRRCRDRRGYGPLDDLAAYRAAGEVPDRSSVLTGAGTSGREGLAGAQPEEVFIPGTNKGAGPGTIGGGDCIAESADDRDGNLA